jgi:hypothetical protein
VVSDKKNRAVPPGTNGKLGLITARVGSSDTWLVKFDAMREPRALPGHTLKISRKQPLVRGGEERGKGLGVTVFSRFASDSRRLELERVRLRSVLSPVDLLCSYGMVGTCLHVTVPRKKPPI